MFKIKIYDYSKLIEENEMLYNMEVLKNNNDDVPNFDDLINFFSSEEKLSHNDVDGYLCYIKFDSCIIKPYLTELIDKSIIFSFSRNIFEEFVFQKGPFLTVIPEKVFLKLKLKGKIYFI